MSLDGFAMQRLTRELASCLPGSRMGRATSPNAQLLQFALRGNGATRHLCLSLKPQLTAMYLVPEPLETLPEPTKFALVLRKHLDGARLTAVRQLGLDRVIALDFATLGHGGVSVTKTLFVELMGKYSNAILAQDGVIIDCLRKVSGGQPPRLIQPNEPYAAPATGKRLNVFRAAPDEIAARLCREPGTLFAALNDCCQGLGAPTINEVAFNAGLSPDIAANRLDASDAASLATALRELVSAEPLPCTYSDEGGKVRAQSSIALHSLPSTWTRTDFPSMSAMLAAQAERLANEPPDKHDLVRLVRTELNRADKKAVKLERELAEAENAEAVKRAADNLLTYQNALPPHQSQVAVTDIYGGGRLTLPLDPRLSVGQNAQSLYKRYAKLKRGQAILREQLSLCRENARYLATVAASLTTSSTYADLAEIRQEMVAAGYLRQSRRKLTPAQKRQSEPLRFTLKDGSTVWVGKNNAQNDRLTFKLARPTDLWLHTRDIPGSHVILRPVDDLPPTDETLAEAARIAAKFSQADSAAKVPVDYTLCRYVKKPSGAKPGFVIFTHERTLMVKE